MTDTICRICRRPERTGPNCCPWQLPSIGSNNRISCCEIGIIVRDQQIADMLAAAEKEQAACEERATRRGHMEDRLYAKGAEWTVKSIRRVIESAQGQSAVLAVEARASGIPNVIINTETIMGLVRAAELLEGRELDSGGDGIWDTSAANALDEARKLGLATPKPTDRHPSLPEPKVEQSFEQELASLINRRCLERGSNTPDFILASYLASCLRTWDAHASWNAKWHSPEGVPEAERNGPYRD